MKNPSTMFVQKSNDHRGIKIEKIDHLDLNKSGTFVQTYVSNPMLVEGHKFDIGVYVVITSLEPLRVYRYGGDVLFRYSTRQAEASM
jgi:tubulin monoglycylase TTLL15